MSSADPLELNEEISALEPPSPESLRARAQSPPLVLPHAHDHNPHTGSTSEEEQPFNVDASFQEDDFSHHKLKQYSSNRSSISSLPASIIHNTLLSEYEDGNSNRRRIPSKTTLEERVESPSSRLNIPGYIYGFRNPSSVRALQLGESEYTDTDVQSVSGKGYLKQRRVAHKTSPYFIGSGPRSPSSTQSSPTKRSSRSGTPQHHLHQRSSSKLKKEFPLVLLHCTILPPSIATRLPQVSDELYEAVLPEEYKKRWRTLQDKVAQNTEVRMRGVLLPHPHEDYDLLEERLLESLELERPRIRQHHFLGSSAKSADGADSGFESSSQTDEASGSEVEAEPEEKEREEQGEKCPDCGTVVSSQVEQEQKWQIKVYAANGLMKAGAWAAAWQEMEKVDVEVGVWMPEEIRAEVDERLTLLQAQHEAEKPVTEPHPCLSASPPPSQQRNRLRSKSARAKLRHDERMKEIYGDTDRSTTPASRRTQAEIDGLTTDHHGTETIDSHVPEDADVSYNSADSRRPHVTFAAEPIRHTHNSQPDMDVMAIVHRRFNSVIQDQKSLAIILLSLLVLFFAIQNATAKTPTLTPQPVEDALEATIAPVLSNRLLREDEPLISYMTTTVFAPISQITVDSLSTACTSAVDNDDPLPSPPILNSFESEANDDNKADTDGNDENEDLLSSQTQTDHDGFSPIQHQQLIEADWSAAPTTASDDGDGDGDGDGASAGAVQVEVAVQTQMMERMDTDMNEDVDVDGMTESILDR